MALPKRKRTSTTNSTKHPSVKRQKVHHHHHHHQEDADSKQFYAVRDIIDENETKYLIDWEDDPVTAERYEPTWEPKINATRKAIEDWEKIKRSRARSAFLIGTVFDGGLDHNHPTAWSAHVVPRKRSRRANLTITSSDTSTTSGGIQPFSLGSPMPYYMSMAQGTIN